MSPLEFIRAAYQLRATHAPHLAVVLALGVILTYHLLVDTSPDWFFH
ncbi:hypothetical protein [Caballeronia sp. BR00000012568055]|nr:hypothetical protein [Caballeronia sp. BR00000012568055]